MSFYDAFDAGFIPENSGIANARALQTAIDRGGTVMVSRPGTYALSDTVYIGSGTTLIFGAGVKIRKVDEQGPFSHVILNKGALTKTYDSDIVIEGLHLEVNGIDVRRWKVFGLHGQLGFFYVRDLTVRRFRCYDLGPAQYGIHICTFEDVIVDDVIIHGHKDGVHFGRGKRFTVRNGVFGTGDDAVALNAHDYDVGNPELGWIENGVVENCHDLRINKDVGFFARILAGAWIDWRQGMEVQKSDTVVSEGRLYRVSAEPDDKKYISKTRPAHASGSAVLDGITWVMVQEDVTYTAGVRNVTFRDIFLEKPRIAFSVHFDMGRYSRSYYPGAAVSLQEQIVLDNVRMLHDGDGHFLSVNTPIDTVSITNSVFRKKGIVFHGNKAMEDYGTSRINLTGCIFQSPGAFELMTNSVPNKHVMLTTANSVAVHDGFSARIDTGPGTASVKSDLPGLARA